MLSQALSGAPNTLEVRGAPDSCRKAHWRWSWAASQPSAAASTLTLPCLSSTLTGMIYYLAVIATLGSMMGAALAWWTIHVALRHFQVTVMELIGEAIRLQDDRIRKGRERDGQRTSPGQGGRAENESEQLAQMMAGQSVDDMVRRR